MSETAETEIDADDIYSQLTGTQKSAILMMLLGRRRLRNPEKSWAKRSSASWKCYVLCSRA